MLSIRHLSKQFPQKKSSHRVLEDVSLDVMPGEIFTLLGPSGCGKTTLLRLIAGLEKPDEGLIQFDGETWVDAAHGVFIAPQKRHIGLVFQSYAIWPHLSVFENIAYPLRQQKLDRATIHARVSQTLAAIGLEGFEDRPAQQLSGGQQQRVAVGRAVVGAPRLLLLDEPFSNLDVGLRQKLRLELKDLQARLGVTMILVTHDQDDAFALSDRIAVLNAGRVEQIGKAETLHDQPASVFVHDFIGKSSTLHGSVHALDASGGLRVRVAQTEITTQLSVHVRVGNHGAIRIRPGDVRLARTGDGVPVEVSHNILLGDRYETYVRFSDGQLLMVYQQRSDALLPGQTAYLQFACAPLFNPISDTAPSSCIKPQFSRTSSWPTTSWRAKA